MAAFSQDATLVAMGQRGGDVEVKEVLTSKYVSSLGIGRDVYGHLLAMAFSPNQQMLATTYQSAQVKLWTLEGICLLTLVTRPELECSYMLIIFSSDSRFVAGAQEWDCSDDLDRNGEGLPCTVHLWSVSNGMLERTRSWQCLAMSLNFGSSSPPLT